MRKERTKLPLKFKIFTIIFPVFYIDDNICTYCLSSHGIRIRTNSDHAYLSNNTCTFNHWNGIAIESFNNCKIYNATCYGNNIEIGTFFGIYFSDSDNTIIHNISISYNGEHLGSKGVSIANSAYCEIAWNVISHHNSYGLILSGVSSSSVQHNDFMNNYNAVINSQCYDSSNNANNWDENYWSDYSGPGSYEIGGSYDVYDNDPASGPFIPEFMIAGLLPIMFSIGSISISILYRRKRNSELSYNEKK